jgi:PAS domain S-box-containing protein
MKEAPPEYWDVLAVARASQAVAGEIHLAKLLETLLTIMVKRTGVERGVFIFPQNGVLMIEAEAAAGRETIEVNLRKTPATSLEVPESILHFVQQTQESVMLIDASAANQFSQDDYLVNRRPKSLLCLPIVKQTKLMGLVYLESNLAPFVCLPHHLAMLELLSSQAAISLENARLYADLALENSNRRKTEETLSRLNRTFETLYQCNRALVHATDELILLQSVCEILVEVGQLRFAWVGYCDDANGKILRPVSKAGYDLGYLDRAKVSWSSDVEGQGPTGIAIRTGKPSWIIDTRTESLFAPWKELAIERGYLSTVALPLLAGGKPFGTLNLYAPYPNAFNENTIAQYTDLTNNLAYGITALRTHQEHRKAEARLRESEQQLQDIVDNTTAIVFVKDLDLRYLLVNREYESRHHIRRSQIIGKTDFDMHPSDIAEKLCEHDRQVVESGTPLQFEEAVLSDKGETFYVVVKFLLRNQAGKPYAVCGIGTDITARKQAEQLQADMVREAEFFAKQRAAQLGKANDALRGCIDALAAVPKLDAFLGQVTAVITGQLGAISSALRLFNFEQDAWVLEFVFQDGRIMSPDEAGYPEGSQSLPLDQNRFNNTSSEEPFLIQRVTDPKEPIPDTIRSYLLELGIQTILILPLISGGEALGRLTLRFAEDRKFRAEEFVIVRTLATLASLAIQLTRLAKAARQSAVLEERNRLAGEIHDSLAQSFAGISLQLDAAMEVLKTKRDGSTTYIERANDIARFGLAEARRSTLTLQPTVIEEAGFIEFLQMLVDRSNIPGKLHCSLESNGVRGDELTASVQQDLLRIAQEAISNALRHAKPTFIAVTLRATRRKFVLEVRDNGPGIGKEQLEKPDGFGLTNMRARAKKLHAELKIRTVRGRGTDIIITVPLNR